MFHVKHCFLRKESLNVEQIYVERLLELASKAFATDEAPVAALITHNDKIIAEAYNQRNKSNSTIAHAEIETIKIANKKLNNWRLNNCALYVTVKPCEMCEKVIKEARIERVLYLVEREPIKRQYNKTKFIKLKELADNNLVLEYRKLLADFWKNKR